MIEPSFASDRAAIDGAKVGLGNSINCKRRSSLIAGGGLLQDKNHKLLT